MTTARATRAEIDLCPVDDRQHESDQGGKHVEQFVGNDRDHGTGRRSLRMSDLQQRHSAALRQPRSLDARLLPRDWTLSRISLLSAVQLQACAVSSGPRIPLGSTAGHAVLTTVVAPLSLASRL